MGDVQIYVVLLEQRHLLCTYNRHLPPPTATQHRTQDRQQLPISVLLIFLQVDFSSFATILREVAAMRGSKPGEVFYDLGSGKLLGRPSHDHEYESSLPSFSRTQTLSLLPLSRSLCVLGHRSLCMYVWLSLTVSAPSRL